MNDTQPLVRPEVAAFVDDVRARLSDLSDDEREELLGGLEADLDEKVADGAPLGDPATYAAELRAAAGLPERTRRLPRPGLPRAAHAQRALDGSRTWFLDLVRAREWSRRAFEVVASLRPVWWVARAWVAVTLLDVAMGRWEPVSLLPSLGHPLWGAVLLVVAVIGSTLVGLGRVWPGSGPDRPVASRLVLLLLNVVAVAAPVVALDISAPGYLSGSPDQWGGYGQGYTDGVNQPGIRAGGREVSNLFAYDADGQPLSGVQLFDQDGRPLAVARYQACPTQVAGRNVLNVFPLQPRGSRGGCAGDAAVPNHPLSAVPPVGLPEAEATEAPEKGKTEDDRPRDGKQGEQKKEERQS